MGSPDRVTARLADGRAGVTDLSTLVQAAALRGYSDADLTLHPGQPGDWYATEDGLDLDALDADAATLRSLAAVAAEALATSRELRTTLTAAFSGAGATAADGFLSRNAAAAATVGGRLERTARCYPILAGQLWRAIDAKVTATCGLAGRWANRRTEWLAAASAVLAGSTDEQSTATVERSVKPFVAESVRGDWLAAMRTAVAAVEQAYRAAVDQLADGAVVRFEIPADLVPSAPARTSASAAVAAAPPAAAPTSPAAASGDTVPPDVSAEPGVSPSQSSSAVPPASSTVPDTGTGSTPNLGSLPTLGSGSGLGLPDFGALEDPFGGDPQPDAVDDQQTDDQTPHDEKGRDEKADDKKASDEESGDEESGDRSQAGDDAKVAPEPVTPEPVIPVIPPEPAQTPCEIAADELPQVGA
ncbi:hypothetical protein MINS_14690 [Mycolicibacterium insubricum]|nr:hypothetical protein [Mycolicibacterium insubricum]MCB9441027.1 hypothetical protein [Mycolicibacterium sp.]BBZ66040.1 hypothetical protein MINS_14690 [Mycolicibacterium insubricum]